MKFSSAANEIIEEKTPYSLVKLGRLYASTGRYDEALRHFNEAILMKPNEHRFYFLKGVCLFHLSELRIALSNFKIALQADPLNKYEILNYTGTIKFKLGEYQGSLLDLEKAIGYYKGDISQLKVTAKEFMKLLRYNQ